MLIHIHTKRSERADSCLDLNTAMCCVVASAEEGVVVVIEADFWTRLHVSLTKLAVCALAVVSGCGRRGKTLAKVASGARKQKKRFYSVSTTYTGIHVYLR